MSGLPATRLGRERKRLASFVIAIGLGTFFLPIVILNPPLLNRAQWSPFHIASGVNAGTLPVPKGHVDEALVEIALLYVLMILALVAVFFRNASKPLTAISTVGFIVSVMAKFWRLGFLYTFGWGYWEPGRMKIGLAWWILPWIMPVLLALCFAEKLDVDQPASEETS
jgi:hypothetical protein